MKIKLPSGVILESQDTSVCNSWISSGGTELTEKKTKKQSKVEKELDENSPQE